MAQVAMAHRAVPIGTVKMLTSGTVVVKTRKNGWVAEHRLVKALKLGRDLLPNEKVFHIDNTSRGEDGHNDDKNLIVIRHRTTQWVKFSQTKILYIPKKEPVKLKEFVRC